MSASTDIMASNRPTARVLLLRYARAVGIGSLAGALSGIVWGVLARIAMRLIAQAMQHRPSFSLEGTLGILIIGAMLGGMIGVIYAGLRRILPWGRIWKALILGVALLLTIGMLLYAGPLVQEGRPEVVPLAMALFGGSLLIWGGLIEALYQPLDRRLLNGTQGRIASIITGIVMALPPLLFVAVLTAEQLGLMEE